MPTTDPETPQRGRARPLVRATIGLLVVLACLVRLVHLDADPHFPTWISYIVDEGRWSESARNLALFGTTEAFADRIHLIMSPAYQVANYLAFRVAGVGFASARASAAIAGILIVLASWFALRRHVSAFALALGVVILGFEATLLAESRTALPELPSLLGNLLAFLVLVVGRQNRRNAFIAGLLAALSVAMKGTTVLVVAVLPLMILLDRRGGAWKQQLPRLAAFLAGFAIPLAVGLAVAVGIGLIGIHHLDRMLPRFLSFLSLADPRAVVWAVFESPTHEARNLMLLAMWFCSWPWMHRSPDAPVVTRSLYLMSALWAGWWLAVWVGNAYSPGRYVVHFIVPATLNVMAGLTLADRGTLGRVAAAVARPGAAARAARLAWLVLPTAVLLATILMSLAPLLGWDASRVWARVALIALLAVLAVIALLRWPPNEAATASLLMAPAAALLLWLAGREAGVFRHFWVDAGAARTTWALTVLLCYAAIHGLARRPAARHVHALKAAVLALLAGPLLVQGAPPVVAPSYSIRDASREIGLRFRCASEARTMSAASMFLENPLRYRELTRNELQHDGRPYDILVLFEHNGLAQRFLRGDDAAKLNRLEQYRLQVHPRYEIDEVREGAAQISVYMPRASTGRCAAAATGSAQRDREAGHAVARHDQDNPAVGGRLDALERAPVPGSR